MCAILDANVVSEVFGPNRPDPAIEFYKWLNGRKGMLQVGGKLLEELSRNEKFSQWLDEALKSGRAAVTQIDPEEEDTLLNDECVSNDSHIIALARASGARLLYSNDRKLHVDFANKELIDNPRGLIYTTPRNDLGECRLTKTHRSLLSRERICRR